jgi:hypothetical protein
MTPALSCARERAVGKSIFYAKWPFSKFFMTPALSCAREELVVF